MPAPTETKIPILALLRRLHCGWVLGGAIILGGVLAGVGRSDAALGAVIGGVLYFMHSWFLCVAARSLASSATPRSGKLGAAAGTVARLVFLGVALALVSRLGQASLLAAIGVLLGSQLQLAITRAVQRGNRCSSN
ncbi:hypothetical protein JW848_09760 [Candidatus Bipolaricaulota bacterium]|nr:hypothetical protein [Candidatus Bipolaricaulota bacterium]